MINAITWKKRRLKNSPNIKYVRVIGVAKNLFNTSVCLRLKNKNDEPKTPAINNENPNCPGKMKSIILYVLPGILVMVTFAALKFFGNNFSFNPSTDCFTMDCNNGNFSADEFDVMTSTS